MAEPEFGDPQTIQDLANAAMRVAADLRQLVELMNRDVEATVPDRWGGEGAGAFTRFWYRFQRSWSMPDTPLGRYADNLTRAAETMRQARSKLQEARAFADREGLEIGNDFRVVARNRNRPDAQALEAQGQELVNNARRMAQTAREQIAMANRILDEDARANIREMMQIKEAFDAARGYRGGPRRRPPTTLGIFGPEGRPRQPRPGLGRWT